ncbi:unnamed protein product [Adineta steineri]|uniref:Uncharacterized protein n=1 Tax=Adineta steineri TaxID=433720 RepID=A0A818UEC9_9BILA|nr:unnamed protein product [Adineta steineri]CAF3699877.1 unnamed protein product [Adineta steineri]
MANYSSTTIKDKRHIDEDKKDIFTLDGYIKYFETCENDAAVFSRLPSILGEDPNDDIWRQHLEYRGHLKKANYLFETWKNIDYNKRNMEKNDIIKYIEIFSLLENVFRNVLLRPYIPAYRAINKYCGRYCCFISDADKPLFKNLGFRDDNDSSELLIYVGTDPLKTIIYAITCNIFWHVLTMNLPKYSSTSV